MTRSLLIHIGAALVLIPLAIIADKGWVFFAVYLLGFAGYSATSIYWQARFASRWENWIARMLFHWLIGFAPVFARPLGAALEVAFGDAGLRIAAALTWGIWCASFPLVAYCAWQFYSNWKPPRRRKPQEKKTEWRPKWLQAKPKLTRV